MRWINQFKVEVGMRLILILAGIIFLSACSSMSRSSAIKRQAQCQENRNCNTGN
jgi:hypothetical protein